MFTTTTAQVTYQGETRETEITMISRDDRVYCDKAFVGTVGAGSAKYPASLTLWADEEGKTYSQRGMITAVTADGRKWHSNGSVVVRNRQARITGWAEQATNEQSQQRI